MTATNSQPSLSNTPPGKDTTSTATSSEERERAIGSLETTGAAEMDSSLVLIQETYRRISSIANLTGLSHCR